MIGKIAYKPWIKQNENKCNTSCFDVDSTWFQSNVWWQHPQIQRGILIGFILYIFFNCQHVQKGVLSQNNTTLVGGCGSSATTTTLTFFHSKSLEKKITNIAQISLSQQQLAHNWITPAYVCSAIQRPCTSSEQGGNHFGSLFIISASNIYYNTNLKAALNVQRLNHFMAIKHFSKLKTLNVLFHFPCHPYSIWTENEWSLCAVIIYFMSISPADPVTDLPLSRCTSVGGMFAFSCRQEVISVSNFETKKDWKWRQESLGDWKSREQFKERPTKYCIKIKYKAPFLTSGTRDNRTEESCIFHNDLLAQVHLN